MIDRAVRRVGILVVFLQLFGMGHSKASELQTIVVLGDSLAAGLGVERSEAFPALLDEKIEQENLPFRMQNAGSSGDTTAGGLRRLGWVLKRPVDVLVLELGGNDGLRGLAPEETARNLKAIIDRVRESNPDVVIVLAGMQMPQNLGEPYREAFRAVFPAVAQEKNVHLVPFLLEGVGGVADLNQEDQIHPNADGHQKVAENVWAVLGPILKQQSKKPQAASGNATFQC